MANDSEPKDPEGRWIIAAVTIVFVVAIGIGLGAFMYSITTNR